MRNAISAFCLCLLRSDFWHFEFSDCDRREKNSETIAQSYAAWLPIRSFRRESETFAQKKLSRCAPRISTIALEFSVNFSSSPSLPRSRSTTPWVRHYSAFTFLWHFVLGLTTPRTRGLSHRSLAHIWPHCIAPLRTVLRCLQSVPPRRVHTEREKILDRLAVNCISSFSSLIPPSALVTLSGKTFGCPRADGRSLPLDRIGSGQFFLQL